jgi:acetolactate synthase I/III small subunit
MFKRIAADGVQRAEVRQVCEIFRGKVVDVTRRSLIVELTGTGDEIDAFERMVRPFGLVEMRRTREIALSRGRVNVARRTQRNATSS